jgi:hypothetical protein
LERNMVQSAAAAPVLTSTTVMPSKAPAMTCPG